MPSPFVFSEASDPLSLSRFPEPLPLFQSQEEEDAFWMREALRLAEEAAAEGEVPVGAVVTREGKPVAFGRNRREIGKNALCHAELEAISRACTILGGWRLWQCTLYVTLEPCPMCAGAILNARIPRLVFGARDPKAGSCGSVVDLFALPFNHHPDTKAGVLEESCSRVLREFFQSLRTKRQKPEAERETEPAPEDPLVPATEPSPL